VQRLLLLLSVVSSGCAATHGQLINGPGSVTKESSATCSDVVSRRPALASRWGEFLRVRIDETSAVIVGQAKLRVAGTLSKERAFFVSGSDLVLESRWVNEKVDVASALPRGAQLELTLSDLTAAAGRCENVRFTVEQGAVVPDIEEAAFIAQLTPSKVSAGPAAVVSRKKPAVKPPPASKEGDWVAWVGKNADFDTSEWKPWPLASRRLVAGVGSPLAKGAWLAWSSQSPPLQRAAQTLADQYRLGALDPQRMAQLVERVRAEVKTDDAAALALFAGRAAMEQATRVCGEGAAFSELSRQALPHERASFEGAELALTLSTAYGLGWPVPDLTEVTSPFGMRDHPILKGERLHTGIDLSVSEGTPIVATGKGVVIRAGETKVNGRFLVIDHGHGVTTAYLHNARVFVTEGQHVSAGDFVSLSGNTGRSTGPHLHYQLELSQQPVDPLFFRVEQHRIAGR
jgi:murein DD-endopeptidase MepM/ murein hydrolase activator NlpD